LVTGQVVVVVSPVGWRRQFENCRCFNGGVRPFYFAFWATARVFGGVRPFNLRSGFGQCRSNRRGGQAVGFEQVGAIGLAFSRLGRFRLIWLCFFICRECAILL